MLIEFSVKNFMSFKDECRFTMSANSDNTHSDSILIDGKERLSLAKIIYGANASGKTAFIKAVKFMQTFAKLSNSMIEKMPIPISPYRFRENYAREQSEFNIVFKKDMIKYVYSFSCTKEKVVDEKLDAFYSAKPTNIFTRTNTNDYIFNNDTKILSDLKARNTENKLFLITAATWNYEKVKPVVEFLLNDIVVLLDNNESNKYNLNYVVENNDIDEFKKFCIDFLTNADFGITDFSINTKQPKDVSVDKLLEDIISIITKEDKTLIAQANDASGFNIQTYHSVMNGDSEEKYPLNLYNESLGTIQMFNLAPTLFYALKEGKTLFVDEIDRSLHPLLVEYIVKIFLDKEINANNAQLICNTHETNLLNLEILRRDAIVFTEMNYKNGSTEMFSLSDFSPRKNENIEKGYLLGRFGAVPFIRGD